MGAMMIMVSSFSQIQLNLGALSTKDRKAALLFAVDYATDLDSIFGTKDIYIAGDNSIFTINPRIKIQSGTEDAFSSIEAKLTGLFLKFKMKPLASNPAILIPDTRRLIQTFPVSIGVESNNTFSNINAVAEVGWAPFYQSASGGTPGVLRYTQIGFFLQGGYKFKIDSVAILASGGQKDQSLEKLNDYLVRAKGSFRIDTKKLLEISGLSIGLVGNFDGWYDIANGKVYHKAEGIARVYLTDRQSIDFNFSNGAGAPNFTTGNQVGLGFRAMF